MRTTLLCVMLAVGAIRADGRIDAVRREVSTAPDRRDQDQPCDDRNSTSNQADQTDSGFGAFFGAILLLPWTGPQAIIEGKGELSDPFGTPNNRGRFPPHPYHSPDYGYMVIQPPVGGVGNEDQLDFFVDRALRSWSVRGSTETGTNFDGLGRVGLKLWLDTNAQRLGLKTDWDYYVERSSGGATDQTWMSDVTLTYRFAQSGSIQMHTGLGVRMMLDRKQTEYGINFLYRTDYFPARPFHAAASIEAGSLGGAGVVRFNASAGYLFRHGELYAGYDFLRIGRVNLAGPMIGLRFWY